MNIAEEGALHRHWRGVVYQCVHSNCLMAGPVISCNAESCKLPPVIFICMMPHEKDLKTRQSSVL